MNAKRQRIFEVIQIGRRRDKLSRAFDFALVTAIILNILALILETFSSLSAYLPLFHAVEYVTVAFFIVEYVLRLWTAKELYDELSSGRAALKFALSADGIIELLTILPFFFLTGFAAFRLLRVVRIFHLFKINNEYDSFHVIISVLIRQKNQLFSSVFIILILIFAASLCMYSVEHDAQPDVFENAFSGIWYSLNTVFTVGYGDIYPVTVLGRIMGAVITILGVLAVAVPTGIISAGFVEEYGRMSGKEEKEKKAEAESAKAAKSRKKKVDPAALELVRAETLAERACAYYVRIEGMARQHGITADKEFDEHDGEGTKYIVLKESGFPVATCRFYPLDGNMYMIGRVVVLPAYRGSGVGRRTVEEAEKWIAELGGEKCILDARDSAVGFYETMGYVPDYNRITYGEIFTCIRVEKTL